jgi:hypothetical protein
VRDRDTQRSIYHCQLLTEGDGKSTQRRNNHVNCPNLLLRPTLILCGVEHGLLSVDHAECSMWTVQTISR